MIITGWSAENDGSRIFAGGEQAVKNHFISLKLEVNIYYSYGCVAEAAAYYIFLLTISININLTI
jgi:hypothetical protein